MDDETRPIRGLVYQSEVALEEKNYDSLFLEDCYGALKSLLERL
jgi:hypothetical protein